MEIKLIVIGKTAESYLKEGISEYKKRISRFVKFDIIELPEVKANKNLSIEMLKQKEEKLLAKYLNCNKVFLLDENGKQYDSEGFAKRISTLLDQGVKCVAFVVGGPYGFSESLKKTYEKISLSKMTFSHQLVRLVFVEQLYRAFTIINSLPYHHK